MARVELDLVVAPNDEDVFSILEKNDISRREGTISIDQANLVEHPGSADNIAMSMWRRNSNTPRENNLPSHAP